MTSAAQTVPDYTGDGPAWEEMSDDDELHTGIPKAERTHIVDGETGMPLTEPASSVAGTRSPKEGRRILLALDMYAKEKQDKVGCAWT